MSRLTGNLALGLFEAYQAVYNPQQYTKDQLWEEVEYWVNDLMREGYDLSDYTWEEMYESYDYYNTIVCYLLDEGYADTNEAALVIMANMSEEWRQSIVDESILDVAAKVGKVAGKVASDVKDRVTGKKELLGGSQGYVRVGGPSKPGDVRVSGIGPVGTYGRKYTPQSGDRPITVGVRKK
jgi:hypothetical protein